MKISDDSVSIVLVGRWNKYIFDTEWIGKNLFKEEKIQVEFPILNFDLPPRFSYDNIRIVLNKDKLEFFALKYTNDVFERIEQMIKTVTSFLEHTPTSAFGINFEYNTRTEDLNLLKLFDLSDNDKLVDADDKLALITDFAIKRTMKLKDIIINFIINKNDKGVSFNFNFHFPVQNATEINSKISGQFIDCKDIAENIIINAYDQQIDNEE